MTTLTEKELFDPSEFKKPVEEWSKEEILEYNKAIIEMSKLTQELIKVLEDENSYNEIIRRNI